MTAATLAWFTLAAPGVLLIGGEAWYRWRHRHDPE